MLKVAILDDYQNVSHEFVDLKKLDGKYEIKIFFWQHYLDIGVAPVSKLIIFPSLYL